MTMELFCMLPFSSLPVSVSLKKGKIGIKKQ
jgi:hypothetical protein